jgi:hypothetical protein
MNARGNPCIDPAETELRAGNDCLRVADDYTAIGEHKAALMFARQAQVHYERAAAIRARQSEARQSEARQSEARQSEARQSEARQCEARQSEAGSSSTGTNEAA